jgi:spore coat polysaccharide biosynthesis protein SpsF
MKRIGVIVQARVGSTRLPGKVLEDIGGRPAIIRVLDRAAQIRAVGQVVCAVPHTAENDVLRGVLWQHNYDIFSADDQDVLSRYYSVAQRRQLDIIVRITGDCPMLDPDVSTRVVERFLANSYDYYSNVHPASYPDGLDTEVFTMDALRKAWAHAKGAQREHVTPYIWQHPGKFRLGNLMNTRDLSGHRWTLDTAEDLAFIRKVYAELGNNFRMKDVLDLPFSHTLTRVDAI